MRDELRGRPLSWRTATDTVFQEATALNDLHHPCIVQLRDFAYAGPDRTRPYLVTEYFEGQTLEQYVEQNGPLPQPEMKQLATSIAEGLAAAHGKQLLHRDVKPSNILVRKEGVPWSIRIIDFGLALSQEAIITARTRKLYNAFTSTLDYASPEQPGRVLGAPIGPAMDVYSFGRTCCFVLFGTSRPLGHHWDQLTPSFKQWLNRCLAENSGGISWNKPNRERNDRTISASAA